MKFDETLDVVVIGSGPAGCATAITLRLRGIPRVCIIDPSENRKQLRLGETLPPNTRALLQDLGLWDTFMDDKHEPCLGSYSSWGSESLGFNDFLLNPYGVGWHLDRRKFDSSLVSTVVAQGVRLLKAQMINGDFRQKGAIQLSVKDLAGSNTKIATRFVVDATGVRSAFARRIGAKKGILDRLMFVYGFFDATDSPSRSQLTVLEAAESGWWYAAPIPRRRLVVAFATDPELVRHDKLLREDRWVGSILRTRHVSPRLEGCRFVRGSVNITIAPTFLLDRVAGTRWMAVGDAAAAYDPISSQGIYKALETGLNAGKALAVALAADAEENPDYSSSISADFEQYRRNRNYLYSLESRWADSPFWRRRRERTQLQWPTRHS